MQQVATFKTIEDRAHTDIRPADFIPDASLPIGQALPALEVLDLTRDFRTGFRRKRQRGIKGVSFSVKRGVIFALLGHNGAGKTTTINCILDLVHAQTGQVKIFGRINTEPAARSSMGYLPERPYFFEHLSGRELLKFYADLLSIPKAERDRQIEEILENVGLQDSADKRLRKYSKGMLQRIGLGQALLGDPDLLILDEPMSGLDPMGRRQVRQLLQSLRDKGKTIILSSHIVPDIEMLADEVAILNQGILVAHHRMSELNQTTVYEVQLILSNNTARDVLRGYTIRSHGGALYVEAAGVDALGKLLALSSEHSWKILGVGTRCSGLEDLFMKTITPREHLS